MPVRDEESRVRIRVFATGGHAGGPFAHTDFPDFDSGEDQLKDRQELFSFTTEGKFCVSGTNAFTSDEYKEIERKAKDEARRRNIPMVECLD